MAQWKQPNRRPATCSRCRDQHQPSADVPDWCPPCPDDSESQLPPQQDVCGHQCSLETRNFLYAHSDPNMFWQCQQTNSGWMGIERLCACPTLFDYGLQRCVHQHSWTRQCDQQPLNATPNICVSCPDCGPGDGGNPTSNI